MVPMHVFVYCSWIDLLIHYRSVVLSHFSVMFKKNSQTVTFKPSSFLNSETNWIFGLPCCSAPRCLRWYHLLVGSVRGVCLISYLACSAPHLSLSLSQWFLISSELAQGLRMSRRNLWINIAGVTVRLSRSRSWVWKSRRHSDNTCMTV